MADGLTEVRAVWKKDLTFTGLNASGGTVQMGPLDNAPGIGPMQLLLTALAGCTGIDIASILQKKHVDFSDLQVKVQGKRADDYPKIWTDIHVTYLIWGNDIRKSDLEQAIRLSEEKYCSVSLMLKKASNISSEYKILKPGENVDQ